MGSREALLAHELRERRAVSIEEHLNVARRDPVPRRHSADAQPWAAKMAEDVRLDGLEPCSTETARACELGGVASGADCQGNQIGQRGADMGGQEGIVGKPF